MKLKRPLSDKIVTVDNMHVGLVTDELMTWLHDPEVTRFLEVRHNPPNLRNQEVFVKACEISTDTLYLAILSSKSLKFIGTATLRIKLNYRTAEVGLLVGDKECWGQGIGKRVISLISNYAFRQLGIRKITAGVYRKNVRSLGAFLGVGFVVEGELRKQVEGSDGDLDDELRLALFPSGLLTELDPKLTIM